MDMKGQQKLLVNEFEDGFYAFTHIEQNIISITKHHKNVYLVAILSVGRREYNKEKHIGMLKAEEGFAKRKYFLEL